MQFPQFVSLLLTTTGISIAAPSSKNQHNLIPRGDPFASATTFTCESDVPQITTCVSRTSAYSCFLATQDVCHQVNSTGYTSQANSGTCNAYVYVNNHKPTFEECTAALQAINDNCVSPGERPNPHDNLPTMRGWQNNDPSNQKCGFPVDDSFPSYELASNNCLGKWGTGCAGQNRGTVNGGAALGGNNGGGPGAFGQSGNIDPN